MFQKSSISGIFRKLHSYWIIHSPHHKLIACLIESHLGKSRAGKSFRYGHQPVLLMLIVLHMDAASRFRLDNVVATLEPHGLLHTVPRSNASISISEFSVIKKTSAMDTVNTKVPSSTLELPHHLSLCVCPVNCQVKSGVNPHALRFLLWDSFISLIVYFYNESNEYCWDF